MPEGVSNRVHQVQLHAPLPHLSGSQFFRRAPEQRRLGMQRLEVPADGHRLADAVAVVEFQHWNAHERIAAEHLLTLVFFRHDVDVAAFHLNAFLGQENAHAPGIGRPVVFNQDHRCSEPPREFAE